MNMKKNSVAIRPVTGPGWIQPCEIARNVAPTPQRPAIMPDVPIFRRNLRPFLSTSVQAMIVMTMLTTLIARSDQFANAP